MQYESHNNNQIGLAQISCATSIISLSNSDWETKQYQH